MKGDLRSANCCSQEQSASRSSDKGREQAMDVVTIYTPGGTIMNSTSGISCGETKGDDANLHAKSEDCIQEQSIHIPKWPHTGPLQSKQGQDDCIWSSTK